jgi:hypothetical protein
MSQLSCGSGHEERQTRFRTVRHGKLWPQTVFRSNFVTHDRTHNQAIQCTMTDCSDTLWPYQTPNTLCISTTGRTKQDTAVSANGIRILRIPPSAFISLQNPFLSAENMKVLGRSAVRQSSTFLQVTAKQTETRLLNLTLHYKVRGQGEHGISLSLPPLPPSQCSD